MGKKAFNKLSPLELERLALLSEECGEVIHIIGKIIRHGYNSFNPFDKERITNRELLEEELGDIQAAIQLMVDNKDITQEEIDAHKEIKTENVQQYLHHN